MRYSLLASFCLFLLLGTSCRKNDTDLPMGTRLDSVTTRRLSDNSVISKLKYVYDTAGRLSYYRQNGVVMSLYKYDAQNRLSTIFSSAALDTLVYETNSRIVRFYRSRRSPLVDPVGIIATSKTFVFDSNNRLIFDSVNISYGIAAGYYKYNYDANDDLQSVERYNGDYRSGTVTYIRQDSTVFTSDGKENPYYSNRFAFYFANNLFSITDVSPIPLSKHNIVSAKIFAGTSTQPNNYLTFPTTYYANGLIHTQVTGDNVNVDFTREYLYR